MEISRWSSERSERKPPDSAGQRRTPEGVPEMPHRTMCRTISAVPSGAELMLMRVPVVFASINHRLISVTRPASKKSNAGSEAITLLRWGISLLLTLGLSACDSSHKQPETERIRELNEIPIAQLRVMLKGYPGEWRADSDRNQQQPEPPAEKAVPPGAKRIALVPTTQIHLGDMAVRDVIAARRSIREFSDTALSLEELSYLLWATQGVTAVQRDEAGEIVQRFRAAPSGGARYPLETYLAISRVQGVVPGIYRYLPNEHQLLLVREDSQISARLMAACYGTPSVGAAAAVFIWSATPYRTEWKYTYLAHRMIAMEAGHVCENLYLAAESCRTGVCAALSYHQPKLDELLGVDGKEEFAIYLASVGKPKPEEK